MFNRVLQNTYKSFKNTVRALGSFVGSLAATQKAGIIAAVVLSVAAAVYFGGCKMAVEVIYNGHVLGYVASAEQAKAIESAVLADVKRKGTADVNFTFRQTVVRKNDIKKVDLMAKTAMSHTVIVDSNLQVAGLYLDGELVAVADNAEKMQSILDGLKQKYTVDGMIFDGFSKEVSIADLTLKQSDCPQFVATVDELLASCADLGVKTYRTEEYDQTVKYTTQYTYDSSKDKSYKKNTREGQNGLKHIVAKVYYLNGEQVSSETVSSKTLKEVVNAKVTVGSKNSTFSDIKERLDKLNAENDGSKVTFIFPLEIRSSGYISSYWGDNRGHKGMDFASPKGTDIYAVADGVVTISTYSDSYGYYIEIKHKDGSKTRYAHASKLLVKVGQTVKQGDHIAEVGTTGRSTGNHLHFEVLINGTRVNPAPYLAIK